MRRRGQVQPRRVIFIGCEGKSERAFVRFLAHLCQETGLHLHLDARPGNGGDSVSCSRSQASPGETSGREVDQGQFRVAGPRPHRAGHQGRSRRLRRGFQVEDRAHVSGTKPGGTTAQTACRTGTTANRPRRHVEGATEGLARVPQAADGDSATTTLRPARAAACRPARPGAAKASGCSWSMNPEAG